MNKGASDSWEYQVNTSYQKSEDFHDEDGGMCWCCVLKAA